MSVIVNLYGSPPFTHIMKKVALFTGTYPDTTFLTLLARGLADSGVEVHIYGKLKGKSKKDRNLKFFTYSKRNKFYNLLFVLKYLLLNFLFNYTKTILLYQRLKTEPSYIIYKKSLILLPIIYHKPDIIHIQWIRSFRIFENLEGILSSKFIMSIRGTQLSISSFLYPEVRKLTLYASDKSKLIHSISDDLTQQLLKINPLIKDKIVKISPAIDLNMFSSSETFLSEGQHHPLRIITVCRLSWKKGLRYGIEALSQIHRKGISFEYVIIGEGSQREELQYLIQDFGLSDVIILKGSLNQKEIRDELFRSDVFLLPSIQEGFSNAVIEAQSMGLPCLVSDAEGLEENIEDAKTGFVFKKREVMELGLLLEKFVALPAEEYLQMKRNAVHRAKTKYDIQDQIISFKQLYERV